ncbi:hypothetical protein QCA50_011209 [Cerrena zonata]|uniref:C2H2-type domain-containing protein n=1 Tax=Cerrena zonata TaxID=2478898 RepID=A0AAW0G2X7_9APHY
MFSKRPRTPPPVSSSRTPSPEPTPKAVRITSLPNDTVTNRPLLCTLPPTCNPPNRPTHLINSKELESHYANYHAHVCEERGCGCVFPEARFLELHQTECHDPIAAVRKDRGEKIFACHLATCMRKFQNPKARRLHLISAHGYPKEYFFAITNKGVGGLLKKWGEGASMIRREWKSRNEDTQSDPEAILNEDEDDDDEDEDEDEETEDVQSDHKVIGDRGKTLYSISSESSIPLVIEDDYEPDPEPVQPTTHYHSNDANSVDSLTDAMGSLKLIPTKIQFGRGAKRGGFSSQNRYNLSHAMDVDNDYAGGRPRGGRGGRGKGRGRGRGGARGSEGGHPPPSTRGETHHERQESGSSARGLGGGHRSGFPRRGRVIGRMVAARGRIV